MPPIQRLETPEFFNRFTAELPGDELQENVSRQVYGCAYSYVKPTPVSAPELLTVNTELAAQLGFDSLLKSPQRLAQILSGNELLPGMRPYAMAYGGHQFGNWAGQLGDGRAINLGEVRDSKSQLQTLQLKGAGPTPFSRHADGRAVLRSSLREYLCSEAMAALGVPTTRALSLVWTGDRVIRDMFYDGNQLAEPGAIVCRVSPSFVRFGNFELPASRGDLDLLQRLMHFVIRSDWPDLAAQLSNPAEQTPTQLYLDWFSRVCTLSQEMVLHWMRVGFVHGVMNTDNISVLGLTIDYGPYGWIDNYDPDWTPNTTDAAQRRYRFGQQPAIVRWNLYQLANAIYPLIKDADALQSILAALPASYEDAAFKMMCDKCGIYEQSALARDLIQQLPALLTSQPTDMTLFFNRLVAFDESDNAQRLHECVKDAFYDESGLLPDNFQFYQHWERQYRTCLQNGVARPQRMQLMNAVNPRFVPRNYLAQQAIDSLADGNEEEFRTLLSVLKNPYQAQPEYEKRFAQKRPAWAVYKPGCSMLSCSS